MGIFTRFRDIISSNLNAMLDRAEDPEKLIKLMIREMEDTLIELKASCAGVIAGRKSLSAKTTVSWSAKNSGIHGQGWRWTEAGTTWHARPSAKIAVL